MSDQEVILFRHAAKLGGKMKEPGVLVLSNVHLCFTGNSGVKYELAWPNVADAKFAPATSNVAAMKVRGIVGNTDEAVLELTGASLEENMADLSTMRELIKELRHPSPSKKLRTLISKTKKQAQLLAADRELAKKYHQLVEYDKILTEEEFWNSHRDRFHDFELEVDTKRMKKGHQHVRSAIIELVDNSKKTEDGKIIINLSEELKLKLFERYPQLRRDFTAQVPILVTEAEFWEKYITRELYRNFENETKFNKFVNVDDNHIATGTYTGKVEGMHGHIGSRPTKTTAVPSTSSTSNSVSFNDNHESSESAHLEVRESLEQAKKRRKFDSQHPVAVDVDLTSTYNDYSRNDQVEDNDKIIVASQGEAKQQKKLSEMIIQQLNEEGFASLLTHEEEAKRSKRIEGFKRHLHHHHHHHHHHHVHHVEHAEESEKTNEKMTQQAHAVGYEDMEEVLHALPHRPKADEETNRLEKRLLDIYQPTLSIQNDDRRSSSVSQQHAILANPAIAAFEGAMDRLQNLLSNNKNNYTFSGQSLSEIVFPSTIKATKFMETETQRLQRQVMEWTQHYTSINNNNNTKQTNPNKNDLQHHHLRPESAEEAQYQQSLLGEYREIAELLLHYYGLIDRLKDLKSDGSTLKLRAMQATTEKMMNIIEILSKKEESLKRKKQQIQIALSTTVESVTSLALEGVVKMVEEILAQIQRAKLCGDPKRLYTEELY